MYQVTADQVNKLRKKTGSGIMDCKKALTEVQGDFDKAIDLLRKKGQKIAMNRSDREANEGALVAKVNTAGTKGVIVGLNCETDFVAKNDNFTKLAHELAEKALIYKDKEEFLEAPIGAITVKEKLIEQTGVVGEKLDLGTFEFLESPFVASYTHHGNKIATLIGFSIAPEGVDQVGKDLAMQVAAMNPMALTEEDLSVDLIEKEKEIAKEQLRKEGKPENMLENIAQGKLKKFYSENTLIHQSFIKDQKLSVATYLKNFDTSIRITAYRRVAL
ncbi:translation elongation factor Ts [Bacteroidetes bacterium endosymbiont of Geopemphigus sp.]|uniref:translation elongation factor Ts n=1 Tax=Bacteroidetes bacterium endosymbiont of Geopemphigus sp. TaxID=2047937 RepID=UPI000CD1F62F|nr:translation elongation factor Ts [Bacteroidetes bacterium endosymbiont of Geopemphigus sp.]